MKRTIRYLPLLVIALLSLLLAACPASVDEAIRENTRVPGLTEGVQARDRSLETLVQGNIMADIELQWYAQTYGIEVEVSHTVATVWMRVKTEEQRDRVIERAGMDDRISEVIDEVEVDPMLDEAPFSEIW